MSSNIYKEIYKTIKLIPFGKVSTYGQLARINNCGPRLVGYALKAISEPYKNIPWHRVVNSKGEISLKGEGFNTQKTLLQKEGIIFNKKNRIDLKKYGWQGREEIQI